MISPGFTMIELLIVLVIMSSLMGFVGPFAINSVEKATAKTEVLKLKKMFHRLSYDAFAQGSNLNVKLNGNQLTVYKLNQEEAFLSYQFESLSFNPQIITVNYNGFVRNAEIQATILNKPLVINLSHES